MHTSRMILDASSWIIKFPKVPFTHRILRAATTALMNHSGFSQDIWKEGRRDRKEGKWLLCFIRFPRQNYISFEQFDSMAGRCGARSTGDRKANEQIVGFAWLARRLNGSCQSGAWCKHLLICHWHLKMNFCLKHCVLKWTVYCI